MQLLQDVFIIENLQILNEGAKNGVMKIRGTFQRAMEANNNGRIYPTAVLENQISRLQPLITERRLCGELDHPQNETVKLSNASHLVTKLEMKDNEVIGEAEVLKTPAGLTAQALINGGVKIGISSRGMGTLSEDHTGNKIVNEDFKLVTFDLVADPSTRGAYPGIAESTESRFARETHSRLKKESNFLTLLDQRFRSEYGTEMINEISKPMNEALSEPQRHQQGVRLKLANKRATREKQVEDAPFFGVDMPGHGPRRTAHNFSAGRQSKREATELIAADGHWYRIADLLREAFGDSLEGARERTAARTQRSLLGRLGLTRGGTGGREPDYHQARRQEKRRGSAERAALRQDYKTSKLDAKFERKAGRRAFGQSIDRAAIRGITKTGKALGRGIGAATRTAGEVAGATKRGVAATGQALGRGIGKTKDAAGRGIGAATRTAGEVAGAGKRGVASMARAAAPGIGKTLRGGAEALGRARSRVGQEAERAGGALTTAASKAASRVGQDLGAGVATTYDAAKRTAKATPGVVKRVAQATPGAVGSALSTAKKATLGAAGGVGRAYRWGKGKLGLEGVDPHTVAKINGYQQIGDLLAEAMRLK